MNIKWVIDFCAQALRDIVIGIGGKMDGFMMSSGFQITVSSEVMAILAVATSLADMRERMGKIVVACDKRGQRGHHEDLEVGRCHDGPHGPKPSTRTCSRPSRGSRSWSTPAPSPTSPSASPRSSPTRSA